MRLKGMAAVFNDAARTRLCESSGSEHYSPEDSDDLSDLVNSFMEHTIPDDNHQENEYSKLEESASEYSENNNNNNILQDLLSHNNEDDLVLRREIQHIASQIIGEKSSQLGFKRTLMSHLRHCGFDAGLCKSRWGKFGKHPAGEYEYVDVNADGNRFIIEVNLVIEFEIARPTTAYTALLNKFPQVLVEKAETMKQVVRIMCSGIRRSMKQMKLHVPPWRRNGYMQAKWFGPYKRTINEIPAAKIQNNADESLAGITRTSITGFEANFLPVKLIKGYTCRGNDNNYLRRKKVGLKVGCLTATLINNNGISDLDLM
ncbi:hypothetical protein M5689_002377 [Euphorbia peplus]|nr:hypothetical protein M5689_002377 [Euphorbia peplus]